MSPSTVSSPSSEHSHEADTTSKSNAMSPSSVPTSPVLLSEEHSDTVTVNQESSEDGLTVVAPNHLELEASDGGSEQFTEQDHDGQFSSQEDEDSNGYGSQQEDYDGQDDDDYYENEYDDNYYENEYQEGDWSGDEDYHQDSSEDESLNNIASDLENLSMEPGSEVATTLPVVIEAPSMTGVDLDKFTLFPQLIPELRVKIWKFTYPGPQFIPLTVSVGERGLEHTLRWYENYYRPPFPIALHVHRESRAEALKSYQLCFADSPAKKFYVNFNKDVFWFSGRRGLIDIPIISSTPEADEAAQDAVAHQVDFLNSFMALASVENFNKIQRLTIGIPCFKRQFLTRGSGSSPLYGLPENLKELLIISAVKGKRMFTNCQMVFQEDEDKGPVDGEDDEPNYLGHGKTWWREQKATVTAIFEQAKKDNPDWKAPTLKFGKDTPIF